MAKILIAEDEQRLVDIIIEYLSKDGHKCIHAADGVDALAILKNNPVDIVILDIMMPNIDGFSVCKITREMYSIPIIILTAKSDESDKLKGYELGADDYMTKPFSPKVLSAKVRALLKRSTSPSLQHAVNAVKIMIVPASRTVYVNGLQIELTHKEFELLQLLISNQNQVFSRQQLLNRIWGFDFEGNTRTVDTHIKTLRKKLGTEGQHIVTLIRSGYKFEVKGRKK